MSDDNRPINPLRLAEKMRSAQTFENETFRADLVANPRLAEILWALQFFSLPVRPKPGGREGQLIGGYPGGLRAFARDLMADSHDLMGTQAMRVFGSATYDLEQAAAVYNEVPSYQRSVLGDEWLLDMAFRPSADSLDPAELLDKPTRIGHATARALPKCQIADALKAANRRAFEELCVTAANKELARFLRELCELPHTRLAKPPWYFHDLGTALVRFMDRRRERLHAEMADTTVSRDIIRCLRRALATRRGVLIIGDTRFGKTEAIRTWCECNPGKARMVDMPSGNSESEFLRAVAAAYGLEIGAAQRGYQFREQIEFIIEQARLALVFDEAQGIFPSTFGRNTPPARLNWIRRKVLDVGVPAAFCATPQSYESARRKFLKATNFAIAQFDKRLLPTLNLPDTVGRDDLLSIARIHFPKLEHDYLEYVVRMMSTAQQNYASDIALIADLVRVTAAEANRTRPNLTDIKAALAEVLSDRKPALAPGAATPAVAAEEQPEAPCRRNAEPLQAVRPEPASRITFDLAEHARDPAPVL